MMATAIAWARDRGLKRVIAEYKQTTKNKPTLEFLQRSGLEGNGTTFVWNAAVPYPVPEVIRLQQIT
jgi:predicted enzyme involved in methoxymalonyl-ACP biosynthesis